MTFDSRLERLERAARPPEELPQFELAEPPPGLTQDEHAAWLQELRKRGPVFTLDLAAASAARLRE